MRWWWRDSWGRRKLAQEWQPPSQGIRNSDRRSIVHPVSAVWVLGSKQAQTLGRQAIYRAAVHVTIAGVLAWRVATDVQCRVEREGTFSRINLDQFCPAKPWSVAGLEHVWPAGNIQSRCSCHSVSAWRVATDVQRRVEREGTFSRLNLDQLCPARPWSVAGLEHVWCAANILLETGQFRGSLRAGRDKLYDS